MNDAKDMMNYFIPKQEKSSESDHKTSSANIKDSSAMDRSRRSETESEEESVTSINLINNI